jgi:hypothetical protein
MAQEECSSTGDGCTCGWRPSRNLQEVTGQYSQAESEQYSREYLAHVTNSQAPPAKTTHIEIDTNAYMLRYGLPAPDAPGHMSNNIETWLIYHVDRLRDYAKVLSTEAAIVADAQGDPT